jgi:hypothetical protein
MSDLIITGNSGHIPGVLDFVKKLRDEFLSTEFVIADGSVRKQARRYCYLLADELWDVS